MVYHDGSHYWLADGFHRLLAAKRNEAKTMVCDVQTGTKRDAILYAVGANAQHGLPRTNADKRRAVEMLLADPEWAGWTDREIGRRAHVAHTFVGKLRSILVSDTSMKSDRKFTHPKTGTVSTMHTENIGKTQKAAAHDASWGEFTSAPKSSTNNPHATSPDPSPAPLRKEAGIGIACAHEAINADEESPAGYTVLAA